MPQCRSSRSLSGNSGCGNLSARSYRADEFLDIDRPSRFQLDRFQADTLLSGNLSGDANFRSMRKPE
jgi:hypothetical protein